VRATDTAGNQGAPASYSWTVDTVAPTASIDSGPRDPSNSASASFDLSADEDATLECKLDLGEYAVCESPHRVSALADGRHTLLVRATDRAGNQGAAVSYSWTVDTVAPTASIDSGPRDLSNSASASFDLSADEDATLECKLDLGDWAVCESPHRLSALADGRHTLQVRATDLAGNQGAAASYAWTVDTSEPETVLGDRPPATTTSTSATFTFSSEADATFECKLDTQTFAGCESPKHYPDLAVGEHRFEVRAKDVAGNVDGSPESYDWTVEPPDNTPPDTTAPETAIISAGPADPTNETTASFSFTGTDDVSAPTALRFQCRLDSTAESGWEGCSSPKSYGPLAEGRHTFEVRAIDAAGNADRTPDRRSWAIDTTPPNTTITSAPPSTTTGTSASFEFTASESGSSFQCALDAGAFVACTSPRQYTGLALGSHTFQVRATDPAGNTDPTPASHTWTIQASSSCTGSTITVGANADSWVLQSSATSNYGNDSVLKVDTKSGANARLLVRFALPAIPSGCQVVGVNLRLYASSYKEGRTLEALGLAASWTEGAVTWNNQPATTGAAATAASGPGYREWTVTSQVQGMYSGANHGLVVRDRTENGGGIEQGFHSREKGTDNPPQLVVTFG
jgi:large repetitive protein